MRKIIRIILTILFLAVSTRITGQTNMNTIIVTVEVKGRTAVLFSTKKWEFLDDYLRHLVYDSLFSQNWITKEIHAYPSPKNKTPDDHLIYLYENQSEFIFPLDTFKLLRGFTGYHTGLDLKAQSGDTIRAAFNGRVRFAANIHNGYGNLVILRHYNGLETYYSHLSKVFVNIEDDLKAGDVVGLVGATGRATGPHLHFETRYRDIAFDPLKLILLDQKCLVSDSLYIGSLFGKTPDDESLTHAHGDSGEVHTVVRGDTLYKIAKKYNTSVDILCQINELSKSSILRIGQKLMLP